MRPRVIPVRRYPLGVLVRLTGALVVACALLTALPAGAAAQLSREPQKVYDDYRSDAAIEPCDHTVAVYRRTLRQITPDIEEDDARLPPRGRGGAARARARPPGLPRAGLADAARDERRRRGAAARPAGSAGGTTPSPPVADRAARDDPGAAAAAAVLRRPAARPAAPPLPRPRPPRRRPSRRRRRSRTRRPPAAAAPVLLDQPARGHARGPADRARPARAGGAAGSRSRCSRGASAGARSGSPARATPGARRPTARAQRGLISSTGSASGAVRTVYNPLGLNAPSVCAD